ncbi:cytochrome P450 [Geodermatophilus bullaregiensis]|uniref:cytochrome P450 n=1 Tax=Geodermatophilus bullaregiensis TaxID=1564160 RepID=UPI00195D40A0|nr:cytochrome P450 [Geodermatophilus bullaregiensis]MBM7805698.1 cytochrome P450 [Geodermatophilus bullaregiensis]
MTVSPQDVDLATVDLSDRDWWTTPPAYRHAAFDRLRREQPLAFFAEPDIPGLPAGPGYHAVTRYADLEAISSQPAVFCSGRGAVSMQDVPAELHEFFGSLISMDDPRHAKIRRIVSKTFTPRMLERTLDSVRAIVDDVLARARAKAEAGDGTIDVVADVAAPIPLRVICDMMGVPEEDRPGVLANSNIVLSGGDPELIENDDPLTAFLTAGMEMAALMERLAAERLSDPRDDLTTALVRSEVDGERLTHQEIASFFILLLVAGNETTRNAISQGLLALSEHPDQWARWAADPGLDRTGVEEVVRWVSPVTWMRRTATRDGEIDGHRFTAGEKFLLFYAAANRDPEVFADPQRFDVSRDPNPHVGFGSKGPHFCLGAHLARRELQVTFRAIFDQLPDLEVTGPPDRLASSFVNGLKRLPARLTGDR